MIHRPKPGESDEDLIRQNEEFKASLSQQTENGLSSSSKLSSSSNKRKPEGFVNVGDRATQQRGYDTKTKSRFSESRAKKTKEGVVDNTILVEAVSRNKEKTAVLTSIVARNVPALSPMMTHWEPVPSPHGFPQVPKLDLWASTESTEISDNRIKKKSLYMKMIEKEDVNSNTLGVRQNEKFQGPSEVDENLLALGDKSFILDGSSGLDVTEEERIHKENVAKLSRMTHEERLRERDELLCNLTEDQIQFILSRRQKLTQNTKENDSERKANSSKEDISEAMDVDEASPPMEEGQHKEQDMNDVCQRNDDDDTDGVCDSDNILTELPIPPSEAKKWLHMDKVEFDKLKWMTNVPKPRVLKRKEGYVARFSFQGDLLPYDADISWREGLHHHGDEPERAGYSLDELFLFVRSQVVQQRHLGLKTLANILRNAGEGLYDSCFDVPIIQLMIDAGLVLLLRFALDETTPIVYQEALRALYYLVACEPDERCLALAEPWTPLGVQPGFSSQTHSSEKDREELDAEEKELKDVEVIKLDVIRALVRTDVHFRLRYFMESVPLLAPEVIYVIGILRRIARHSQTAGWTLVQTPRLLECLVRHFLPYNTTPLLSGSNVLQLDSVYGVPLSHALSLFKVLASRGRSVANTLLEKYDLMNRILAYVSLEPTEVRMPLAEVLSLAQEALALWAVFLSYGLTKAQQGFSTFYPLIVKQLVFYRDKVHVNDNVESNHYNYEIGAHLMNVLVKALSVAATKSLLVNRMKNKEPSVTGTDGKELVLQPPVLDWKDFEEMVMLVEVCLTKWVTQLVRTPGSLSFSGYKLLGSGFSFLATYLSKWRDQRSFEGVAFVKKVEALERTLCLPLLTDPVCDDLCEKLRQFSALCSPLKLGKVRDASNLGTLWSVCQEGSIIPLLQNGSPLPFLLPFTHFLKTIFNLHPSMNSQHIQSFLSCSHMKRYLRAVCSSERTLSDQWFTRVEIYTVVNLLQLSRLKTNEDKELYHRVALIVLPLIHKGDEHLVKSLVTDVICNPDFSQDLFQVETGFNELTVKDFTPLKSPAFEQPSLSTKDLTQRVSDSLPSIGQNLLNNILHSRLLEKSSLRHGCVSFLINDLTIDREEVVPVVDCYWPLNPLKLLILVNDAKEEKPNVSQPETIAGCLKWLQMTYFILKYRKEVLQGQCHLTGWFRHLSNVFLASSDFFLDNLVSSYTQACLFAILENGGYKQLDPSWTFHDLGSCFDWYKAMVEHFASVSYGDATFALVILIPLMRHWPSDYRLLLFGDLSDALPFIRLSADEVSQFLATDLFLNPVEDDQNVVMKYRVALGSRLITQARTPFLYQFATHHILKQNKK